MDINAMARELIESAKAADQVVTIELKHGFPPAMGNYEMVADVRPARHPKPEPDYAALEREHLGDPDKGTGIYHPENQRAPTSPGPAKHPMQPLITDQHGVWRFKANKIVDFLASKRLNELATMDFPQEDWEQLAQLIGYSLDGFGTLSYVSSEAYAAAERIARCDT